ncbi:MAG: WXG100 family type VII secretion target [Lachnospiraceae bacterium]|nr:WXG100 family type VII secretion target [Lachnospiraceae bacterium]
MQIYIDFFKNKEETKMAVSTIQLTQSALAKKKNELETLNTQLKSQIKDMNSTEKSLMGMWEGDAAKAFDAAYDKDGQSFEKFTDLVTKYVGALESIMKLYEKAEQKNIQTAKKRSYK